VEMKTVISASVCCGTIDTPTYESECPAYARILKS
jgi:hypothetical protein